MHLTYRPLETHKESDRPTLEDEVTPALVEALERAFYEWWGENSNQLSMGVCGDVLDLRSKLYAASANS